MFGQGLTDRSYMYNSNPWPRKFLKVIDHSLCQNVVCGWSMSQVKSGIENMWSVQVMSDEQTGADCSN